MAIPLIVTGGVLLVTNVVTGGVTWRQGRKVGRRDIIKACARLEGIRDLADTDADTMGRTLMSQDERLVAQQVVSDEIDQLQKDTKALLEKQQAEAAKAKSAPATVGDLVGSKKPAPAKEEKKEGKAAPAKEKKKEGKAA